VLAPAGEARVIVYHRNSIHYWVDQVLGQGLLGGRLLRERSMAGVLAGTVEHSGTGARALVRVYSAREARRMMAEAGFERVTTTVHHFRAEDSFVTRRLRRRVRALRDPSTLDRIGRAAGWYLCIRGFRAAA
jgi:hypothetical protein